MISDSFFIIKVNICSSYIFYIYDNEVICILDFIDKVLRSIYFFIIKMNILIWS